MIYPRCSFPTLLVVVTAVASAAPGPPSSPVRHFQTRTMGTIGTLSLVGADSAEVMAAARAAFAEFERVDSRLSNWSADNELARIQAELQGGRARLSSLAAAVMAHALRVARASGGAFDPTVEPLVRLWGFLEGEPAVPDSAAIAVARASCGYTNLQLDLPRGLLFARRPGVRLDLGGVAKGYAVDLAVETLRLHGMEAALVDLSGNMRGIGHPPGRSSWTVGIRDPDSEADWFARLRLEGLAVATSGNYEQFVDAGGRRFGHVIDPRTGWPAEGLDAVTVLAPTAVEADAWATALLVLGPEEARRVASQREDLHAILVQSATQGRRVVWVEESLRGRFDPVQGSGDRFPLRWF